MRGRLKTKRRLAVLVAGIAMVITGSVFYLVRASQIDFEIARSRGRSALHSAPITVLADDTGKLTGPRAAPERAAELLSDPHIVPLPAAVWSVMALMGAISAMRLLNWARAT
jgi:hypothetical protein